SDLERYRLRSFVAELPPDEIETRDEPIDLAAVADALEGNARAVLFRAVGPERHELVGNVTGNRARIARAFGVAPQALLQEVERRLRNRPGGVEVQRAEEPAPEIGFTGCGADAKRQLWHLQQGGVTRHQSQ